MTLPDAVQLFIFETTRFVSPMVVAIEWTFVILGALFIGWVPRDALNGPLCALRDGFRRLASRKRLAVISAAALPLVLRLSVLGIDPVPEPSIHDEFSHLLLGDTLAHGRLTNPTHPMWRHFESIHIIQRPTYNSMYPPGQGAFLAFGETLFHEPWAGVLLSVALMCAAACWMMQGWLPPVWAFYGAILLALKLGLSGFWIDSYMGGSAAAIGGALVIGAVPRILSGNARIHHSVLLGTGAVTLMNTRPLDGALLTGAALIYLVLKMGPRWRLLLPAAAVIACGAAFTGYYCFRVTGNPMRLPYQVNRDTYGWPENLAVLPPKKVDLAQPNLRNMYLQELRQRDRYNEPLKIITDLANRLFENWTFLLGPALSIPLIFLPLFFRSRQWPLLLFMGVVLLLNLFQLVLYPYHLAPVAPVLFALVTVGARYLYMRLESKGRYAAIALPLCLVAVAVVKHQADEWHIPLSYWERGYESHRDTRAYIEQWLKRRQGKHLVIVHYSPDHAPDQEWVYNGADIDSQRVVWAQELDPESNRQLLSYFHDRHAWLLKADEKPARVVRYQAADEAVSSN